MFHCDSYNNESTFKNKKESIFQECKVYAPVARKSLDARSKVLNTDCQVTIAQISIIIIMY
jgi:hypothetical protein